MTEVINEIVAAIDQIVFWLKVTVYLIGGICFVWVIGFIRRNLGLHQMLADKNAIANKLNFECDR